MPLKMKKQMNNDYLAHETILIQVDEKKIAVLKNLKTFEYTSRKYLSKIIKQKPNEQ
jgi:hypothetical protein